MRCALYFGSFNPFHKGHAAIVRYVLESRRADCVRLVLSPHNPLKEQAGPEEALRRLHALEEAVGRFNRMWRQEHPQENGRVETSDIEFRLPEPLYTYNTLKCLQQQEPRTDFVLVIGADNLSIIERWYRWQDLFREFPVWVYPRPGYPAQQLCDKYGATCLDAPLYDISSTRIREGLAAGEDMREYLF